MKVLVIYEIIRQETKAYILEDSEAEHALLCAGLYGNTALTEVDEDSMIELDEILERTPSLNASQPIRQPVDAVVVCDFIK